MVVDNSHTFPCFTVIVLEEESMAWSEERAVKLDSQFAVFHAFINLVDVIGQNICNSWEHVLKGLDAEHNVKVRH
jgi:hypothetical protein